jgi:molybdopterin/thiamine biosynthesis adenylyltransferase
MKSFKVENEHLTRQLEIIPMESLDVPITVIGAGAVGGWTVLSLAKMGFQNITVYDDDEISIENMNCQFYPYSAIGKSKVETLTQLVEMFANVKINAINGRYDGATPLHGIVISAVDSMQARSLIWDAAKKRGTKVLNVIDPRMGAETSLLYVMNPKDKKDKESYEKTLYTDDNAVAERCTAKATIYTANLLAGQVCKAVKDLATGNAYTRVSQWDIGKNHVVMWNKK